jgi:Phage major capsid protein E
MPINPSNNTRAVDFSEAINLIPNSWGLFGSLGVFSPKRLSQRTAMIAKKELVDGVLVDRNYNERANVQSDVGASGILYRVPHFPVDDAIYPSDLSGQVDWTTIQAGTEKLVELSTLRTEKIESMRRKHALIWEHTIARAMMTGEIYAPGGTLKTTYGNTINMYNEWGLTRKSFAIKTGVGYDPRDSMEAIIADLQDSVKTGETVDQFVIVCSPGLFSAVTANAYVKEQFKYQPLAQAAEVLVGRLVNKIGLDARYRSFAYGGMVFVEYRGTFNGSAAMTANQGVAFPVMQGLGQLAFAPAETFSAVNKPAQDSYLWERMSQRDDKLELESETNVAGILLRPELAVTITFDPAAAP